MKKSLIAVLLFSLIFTYVEASEQKAFEIPRTQVIPIEDTGIGRQYELYVKLPEGYEENDTAYPVIYFTDAVWHIELLSAATEFLMEDVILVGISWQTDIEEKLKKDVGAHVSRFRDYTVVKSDDPERQAKYQFGQAGKHLDFIRNDVISYVEKNYRTDSGNRTYFGYSAGGLFGAYILLAEPDTFTNYMLGSPSVRDIPTLFGHKPDAASKLKDLNVNVFVSYGSLEEELSKYVEEFITLLKNRNSERLSLQRFVIEGSHQTAFPLTGVQGVTWLSNLTNATE